MLLQSWEQVGGRSHTRRTFFCFWCTNRVSWNFPWFAVQRMEGLPVEMLEIILGFSTAHPLNPPDVIACTLVCRLWADVLVKTRKVLSKYKWSCERAAKDDEMVVFRWLYKKGCSLSSEVAAIFAERGNLYGLRFLRIRGCRYGRKTYFKAGVGGNIDVINWLRGCDNGRIKGSLMNGLIVGGHMEILEWLYKNGTPMEGGLCTIAATRGDMDMAKWLCDRGCSALTM